MDHTTADNIPWEPAPADHFTGTVYFGPLSHVSDDGLHALAVQFEPGARTDWHWHPDGQVLYVTEGAGLVANAKGERVRITAGDVVYAAPDEVHWHGALPSSPMTHLSLTTGDATVWEPRKVDDGEYAG
ncbi:MAG: cupin domain-containing protein [Acidimicrobiia bacterium]|nr:cupin domain-containing protein [Acidimicrobiia bacterium]NNC75864.1 cupin domain-containing protein [Acidimicrobiia bacterium]